MSRIIDGANALKNKIQVIETIDQTIIVSGLDSIESYEKFSVPFPDEEENYHAIISPIMYRRRIINLDQYSSFNPEYKLFIIMKSVSKTCPDSLFNMSETVIEKINGLEDFNLSSLIFNRSDGGNLWYVEFEVEKIF